MSTVNSDLKSFAVFVNSKSAAVNTTYKSEVSIPFTSNLAYHEPMKTFKFSFIDMLFTNIFYNIRVGAQTFKYVDVFDKGRGYTTPQYILRTVVIPEGFYDYTTLTDYLNQDYILNKKESYNSADTTKYLFPGFGAYATTAAVPTPVTDPTVPELLQAKVVFQSPSLGALYQPDLNLTDSIVQPYITYNVSWIYIGKYIVEDTETYPLLRVLGLTNATLEPSPIPYTPYFGYGFKIYYRLVGANTQFSFDNKNFGTSAADTTVQTIVPVTVTDLSGLDDVYIHCAQFRTHYQSSTYKGPLQSSDVIAVVPISVPFGQKMSWVPQFALHAFLNNTNITQLDFRLTNSNNELLNFNGLDWSMTLFCEEEDDTSRIQLEENGTFPTSLQITANTNAGAYMQERQRRSRRRLEA